MPEQESSETRKSPFEAESSAEELASSASLRLEAKSLLEARQKLEREAANHGYYPTLNAFGVRAAYFGLSGRLFPSMDQISNVMLKSGPVGQAAHARMGALSEKGWTFGAMSAADPYIKNRSGTSLGRWASMLYLGGYNDAAAGRITHNSWMSAMHTVMGFSNGAERDAASKYIHELAHGKYSAGYLQYEASPAARQALGQLGPEAQKVHGAMMVQEELRAITAQAAANSHLNADGLRLPQTKGLNNYAAEAALKQNQLGGLVKEVWPYDGHKYLSRAEANISANNYLKQTYGEVYANGAKLNPQAERAIAAEIALLANEAPKVTSSFEPGGLKYSRFSHGVQAAGGLLMLNAFADINTQFRISTASGLARLSSVGVDWAGFEAGVAAGGWLGEGLANRLVRSNPRLAILAVPLTAIGGGVIASQLAHEKVGRPLEQTIKSALENKE